MSFRPPKRYDVCQHPLAPFSAERICAKCGGDDIGADYRNDGCSDRSCTTCPVECIVRTCRRCHFQWAEAPLDTSTVDDHEKASGVEG